MRAVNFQVFIDSLQQTVFTVTKSEFVISKYFRAPFVALIYLRPRSEGIRHLVHTRPFNLFALFTRNFERNAWHCCSTKTTQPRSQGFAVARPFFSDIYAVLYFDVVFHISQTGVFLIFLVNISKLWRTIRSIWVDQRSLELPGYV